MSEFANRVIAALEQHPKALAPAIKQLMAEAWDEGAEAAIEREHTYGATEKAKHSNPYRSDS
jgi:hypothetical protein